MNVFTERVRSSKIAHPTQHSFTLEIWEEAFAEVNNPSELDNHLYSSGIWIYKKLHKIRDIVNAISFNNIPKTVLLKYFCGYINRVAHILSQKKILPISEDIFITAQAIQATTHENILNPQANPDQVLTATIDGGRFPLMYIMQSQEESEGVKTSLSDDEILNNIQSFMLLGDYYDGLENIWMECLWHDYYIKDEIDFDAILNLNLELGRNQAISDYRRQSLIMEFIGLSVEMWKHEFSDTIKTELCSTPKVKIDGSGTKKRYILFPSGCVPESPPMSVMFRAFTQEPYLNKLINSKMPNFYNLTVEELLAAWELLYNFADTLLNRFPEDSGIQTVTKLFQYAPSLKKQEVIELISRALKVNLAKGANMLDVFTFKERTRNDLWYYPFIAAENNILIPLIAPMLFPNLVRNIDFWLKKGGIDFSVKGIYFEEAIISDFKISIKDSKKIDNVSIHSIEKNEFGEQIDLVIRLGNTFLIGEVKCIVFPSEPLDFYNYYEVISKDAVNQIKRKTEVIYQNINKFLELLELGNDTDIQNIKIIPFVLTNQPFHVGFAINNVAIVDKYILFKYFDSGEYERYVTFKKDGKKIVGETVHFYKTQDEAEKNIAEYLLNPPQIEFFKKYVKAKINTLPPLDENDKKTVYMKLFVELPLQEFRDTFPL